jgi:hypothetical protein
MIACDRACLRLAGVEQLVSPDIHNQCFAANVLLPVFTAGFYSQCSQCRNAADVVFFLSFLFIVPVPA